MERVFLILLKGFLAVCILTAMFCAACMDSEPLPVWLVPALLISSAGVLLGGWLYAGWFDEEEEGWDVSHR